MANKFLLCEPHSMNQYLLTSILSWRGFQGCIRALCKRMSPSFIDASHGHRRKRKRWWQTHTFFLLLGSYMISEVLFHSESQQFSKMPDTQELFQETFIEKNIHWESSSPPQKLGWDWWRRWAWHRGSPRGSAHQLLQAKLIRKRVSTERGICSFKALSLLAPLDLTALMWHLAPETIKRIKEDSKGGLYPAHSKYSLVAHFPLSSTGNCTCQ